MANHNTHFIVRNVAGTTGLRCSCGNWLAHWRKHSGSRRTTCAQLGCQNPVEVGAHVESTDGRRVPKVWIAPLCKTCNHLGNVMEMPLDSRTYLVPATELSGCGR